MLLKKAGSEVTEIAIRKEKIKILSEEAAEKVSEEFTFLNKIYKVVF